MEVVQHYLTRYHKAMDALSVFLLQSNHMLRAISSSRSNISKILDSGYAYISDGSVYFDVPKFNKEHPYGKLSGRNIDELSPTPAPSTDRTRSTIRPISHSGKRLPRTHHALAFALERGIPRLATSNARQWARNISVRLSTYTEAAWISCSPPRV